MQQFACRLPALHVCPGGTLQRHTASLTLPRPSTHPSNTLQHTSDYVPQLEAFVPLLCANAKPRVTAQHALSLPASGGGSPTKASLRQRRSASAGLAAEVAAAEAWDALRAACLRALLEHLRFCARLSYVSYHLHTITFAVLECVDASGQGAPKVRGRARRAAAGVNCAWAASAVVWHAGSAWRMAWPSPAAVPAGCTSGPPRTAAAARPCLPDTRAATRRRARCWRRRAAPMAGSMR